MMDDRGIATGQDISEKEFVEIARKNGATEEMIEEAKKIMSESKKNKMGFRYMDFLKML